MILSDFDLEHYIKEKRLIVKPLHKNAIRENGIDLRLGNQIAVWNPKLGADYVLDPYDERSAKEAYVLKKGMKEFLAPRHSQFLITTLEYMELPDNLMGFIQLRSTWCRYGLSLPPSIIDAGFKGNITLEIINNSNFPIKLRPGSRFAHIIFAATLNRVRNAYAGTYLGQRGVRLPKAVRELP